ncbi:MAG: ATP-binding cassette domain-containing protein [Erysipelotrichaceae bacterium]|nr:ATP-binding cassette domain-containing protein [Erysipelotrichaceae bacterium]
MALNQENLDEVKENNQEAIDKENASKHLLVVSHLKKYFPVAKDFFGKPIKWLRAVDDVSFTLDQGKTLGIVGESGCGKTTLGRTILKLYDIQGGNIYYDGKNITNLKSKEMIPYRCKIQYVFQDPYSSLPPRLPIGEIIAQPVRIHNIVAKDEVKKYVLHIMKECGLQPHYYDRYPHEFSGGQRQRICIARSLAVKPNLVVLDEPVSALDVSIQAQIINLLKKLQTKEGFTYIFITHDISVVKYISDEIGVMYLGSMVEKGSKESIFANPLHPYTNALFSAVPVADPKVKMNRIILKGDIPSPSTPPKGCKFHTRCNKCMDICKEVPPCFKEIEKGHFVACHLYDEKKEN